MRMGLIFLATLQGLATLVNGGIIPAGRLPELIDDAVVQFLPTSLPVT